MKRLLVIAGLTALLVGAAVLLYLSGSSPHSGNPAPQPAISPDIQAVSVETPVLEFEAPAASAPMADGAPRASLAPSAPISPALQPPRSENGPSLAPVRVRVRSARDGGVVANAVVNFIYATERPLYSLRTDDQGLAEGDDLPANRSYAKVIIEHAMHKPTVLPDVQAKHGELLDLGTVVLQAGAVVRGQCRRPDGRPVARARIQAKGGGVFNRDVRLDIHAPSTLSDDQGRYVLGGLMDGLYWLAATVSDPDQADHAAPTPWRVVTVSERRETLVDFEIGPLVAVGGRVLEKGVPIEHREALQLRTNIDRLGPDGADASGLLHLETNDSGSYLARIPPGLHEAVVRQARFRFTVPAAEVHSQDFDRGAAGVRFTVHAANRTLFPHPVRIALRPSSPAGRPMTWLDAQLSAREGVVQCPNGQIDVPAGPGAYTMIVMPHGFAYHSAEIIVPDRGYLEWADYTVADESPMILDVRFTGLPLEFLPDMVVTVHDQRLQLLSSVAPQLVDRTQVRAAFHGLPEGWYDVTVHLPTGRSHRFSAALNERTHNEPCVFEIAAGE